MFKESSEEIDRSRECVLDAFSSTIGAVRARANKPRRPWSELYQTGPEWS